MSRAPKVNSAPSALVLIEEATLLLRQAPASLWAMYAIGTVPFGLGLLYFLTDMARSPAAGAHLLVFSLGVALLYLWMSCWQAAFLQGLGSLAAGQPAPVWDRARLWRLIQVQGTWQPSALLILPLAMLVALPYGWAYAWYQNVAALDGSPGTVAKQARQQAILWPGQNHVLLSILSLFAALVFLNLLALLLILPILLRMFTGVENLTTSAIAARLNSTLFLAVLFLSYLCLDPLLKSCYVLRCFYGESVRSGEDLRAGLRRITRVAVLLLALSGSASFPAAQLHAAEAGVDAVELDRSLDRVIHQREYAWRMPRDKQVVGADDPNGSFFVRTGGAILRGWRRVWRTLKSWVNAVIRAFTGESESSGTSGQAPAKRLQVLLYVLSGLLAVLLAIVWWRISRQRTPAIVKATASAAAIDLTNENVTADLLPEEGWTKLAQEWLDKSDPRMALRALYLASLAHLAQREIVVLHPAKSNFEYALEVQRRTRTAPVVNDTFRLNLRTFERSWYGRHEVTPEVYVGFRDNFERLRQHAHS